MNRIKEAVNKLAREEDKTYDELAELSGFKYRSNFSTSVNKENIKLRRFKSLCNGLGYKVVLIKGKNKIEL